MSVVTINGSPFEGTRLTAWVEATIQADSVLERLRQEANRFLAKQVGTDDPYRPAIADVPGVLGWADQTALPADAEMIPNPNISIVEVLCEDETVVDALEDAGAVVWCTQEEPDGEV